MLLLDEILEQTPGHIRCRKTFRPDEFFLQGHFPDEPVVPGVILCETCFQAGAVLLADEVTSEQQVPVVTRMNNVKFKRIVRPADTIEIEVSVNEQLAQAFFMTGKVTLNEKLVARLEFACTVTQP